jgi:hypothetical protein
VGAAVAPCATNTAAVTAVARSSFLSTLFTPNNIIDLFIADFQHVYLVDHTPTVAHGIEGKPYDLPNALDIKRDTPDTKWTPLDKVWWRLAVCVHAYASSTAARTPSVARDYIESPDALS